MKVFVTGGSGYIGSATLPLLLEAGHEVLALARSPESAAKLQKLGSKVLTVSGDLNNIEVLRKAAAESDAVIHLGFIHDFNDFANSLKTDVAAIKAIGDAIAGTNKPFIGTGAFHPPENSQPRTEKDRFSNLNLPRVELENVLLALKDNGVRSLVIRLPVSVHGPGKSGFIPEYVRVLKSLGAAEYIGDGTNRWAAVNVADAAQLYKLVLEKGTAGSVYHAIGETGIQFKEIAALTAKGLGIETKSVELEEAQKSYTWLAFFLLRDIYATSLETQKELGWKPVHGDLAEDILNHYT